MCLDYAGLFYTFDLGGVRCWCVYYGAFCDIVMLYIIFLYIFIITLIAIWVLWLLFCVLRLVWSLGFVCYSLLGLDAGCFIVCCYGLCFFGVCVFVLSGWLLCLLFIVWLYIIFYL